MNKHVNKGKHRRLATQRGRYAAISQNTLRWVMENGKAVLRLDKAIPFGINRAQRRKLSAQTRKIKNLLV